jgi:hypothetical protein
VLRLRPCLPVHQFQGDGTRLDAVAAYCATGHTITMMADRLKPQQAF